MLSFCWELQRITRLVNIVWQSALPPTLCAICTFVLYFLFSTAPRVSAPDFCPCSGFCWVLFAGAHWSDGTLTTGFPFSENSAVLVPGCPSDDWEALRSFALLHDVRRLDVVCVSVVHTISDLMSSNAQPLQPDERPTTFISTLTVPAEFMYTQTRNARVGDVACGEIAAECGPARTLDFPV